MEKLEYLPYIVSFATLFLFVIMTQNLFPNFFKLINFENWKFTEQFVCVILKT